MKGVGFSNKLSQKANQLEGTKYKNELEKKGNNNPEENFKKLEKEINTMLEQIVKLRLAGTYELNFRKLW